MSSPGAASDASLHTQRGDLRISVLDDTRSHEVFDAIELVEGVARVRSPFLFEIGEELRVRVEQGTTVFDASVRVRAHVGPSEARVTELEILERSDPRGTVGG